MSPIKFLELNQTFCDLVKLSEVPRFVYKFVPWSRFIYVETFIIDFQMYLVVQGFVYDLTLDDIYVISLQRHWDYFRY